MGPAQQRRKELKGDDFRTVPNCDVVVIIIAWSMLAAWQCLSPYCQYQDTNNAARLTSTILLLCYPGYKKDIQHMNLFGLVRRKLLRRIFCQWTHTLRSAHSLWVDVSVHYCDISFDHSELHICLDCVSNLWSVHWHLHSRDKKKFEFLFRKPHFLFVPAGFIFTMFCNLSCNIHKKNLET